MLDSFVLRKTTRLVTYGAFQVCREALNHLTCRQQCIIKFKFCVTKSNQRNQPTLSALLEISSSYKIFSYSASSKGTKREVEHG